MTTATAVRGTALITGATAGIGAAFVRQLAALGHDLVLVARDEARLNAVADEMNAKHGVQATTLVADLSTPEGCSQVEQRLAAPAGPQGAPIDLLVNNAGVTLNRSFLRTSADDETRLL